MKSYEWKLRDGRTVRLECEYEATIQQRTIYSDGYEIPAGDEIVSRGNLVAYIDGKKFNSCRHEGFWRVIDTHVKGIKKIWGIEKIGFDEARAAEIEAFLQECIAAGQSDEVKNHIAKEAAETNKRKVESAKATIAKAEQQADIPDKAEAERRMRAWNDVMNEGGEGFVPWIVSREEYENAKAIVKEYEKEEIA